MTVLQWTPNGGEDFFGQLQWNDLVFSPNVFGHLANGGEGATLAKWDLPIDGGPAIVQNRMNCFNADATTDAQGNADACRFCFSGSYDPNNTFTIRQYTQVVLGSNAGYEQTWGRSCGALSLINNVFRGGAGGQGANQAYDLTPANAAVGFPSLVSAMPNTDMVIDWYECGDTGGCYNIFTDIYLHEVNDRSLLPTNATNGGSPQTQYQGTINGISQNDTKLWNFNFWHNTNP
jgi:hypothetical protein